MNQEEKLYDVLILGGGPAGLSAAIYAGRAGLSVLVVERGAFGGNIFQTAEIANYPGVLPGEKGAEMAARLEAHSDEFGAEKVYGAATAVTLIGDIKEIICGDKIYKGRSLILATGSAPMTLGIPGEDTYVGRGVSYCAICDGPFFSGLDIYVVGGSYSAIEESLYLSGFARHVTIIHRRDTFRAAKTIIAKAEQAANISFLLDTIVTEVGGDDLLTRIEIENVKTGERRSILADEGENFGFFVFAGMKPETEIFDNTLDTEGGYIVTDEDMYTNIPGVFAAGDVRYKKLRQIVTAAADGAIAAIEAEKYIMEKM